MITADDVRKILAYDPKTGDFTWIVRRGRLSSGSVAGSDNGKGYILIPINGAYKKAHRIAFLYMTGNWPCGHVDHINGDKADNRWANLRESTISQNTQNAKMYKSNTSGVKGVRMSRNKWRAQVSSANGKYDETFPTLVQAEDMAKRMRAFLHGEFANNGAGCE